MITTKGVEVECPACKEPACGLGKRICLGCGNTGQKTTPIPVEYQEEVERLLKVEKPTIPGDSIPEEISREKYSKRLEIYTQAQQRLSEIEQSIIKNSKG